MTRILAICDAPADFRGVRALVDRALVNYCWMRDFSSEDPDFPEAHTLADVRAWVGLEPEADFSTPSDAKRLATVGAKRVRFTKWGSGQEAKTARKALTLAARLPEPPDAVVMVRDTENQSGRLDRMLEALSAGEWPFGGIFGVQEPMREAWILAALDPSEPSFQEALHEERERLSFDPLKSSHRLNAKSESDNRHPKRVLRSLDVSSEQEPAALWRAPCEQMRANGASNGLAPFLDAVQAFAESLGG